MSVSMKVIEFEQRQAHLSSELDGGPPYTVHGIALGADDVTRGASGIKKIWPADELRKAAETLEGTNLVEDHNNDSRGVVGQVTKAGYKEGVGVLYEAELFDNDLANKIADGLLEVSVRGYHVDVEEMDEHEQTGAKVVEDIEFDNLSIVPSGASPSNTLDMGAHDELSAAELSAYVSTLQEDEESDEEEDEAEIEPGMWVEWDDGKGITISQVKDGEIEVDVYEEQGDKWASAGETTMVSTDSLDEWDIDEEEDITAPEEESEEESEEDEEEDEEEAQDIPEEYFYESEEDAMAFIEDKDALTGVHEMDDGWLPGDTHEEFLDWWDNQAKQSEHGDSEEEEEDEEEMAAEGEEPLGKQDKMNQPERYPEVDGDTEPNEPESSGVHEELQDYEMHTPDWSGTTESDWSSPDMEDFDTDDLSEIADHFLISATGFPPENFGDLKLPVVEPNGDLNVNALSAVKGGRGVSAVDGLSDSMEQDIIDWVNNTANEEFDKNWGESEEENSAEENGVMARIAAVEELQDYEMHEPEWSGTTESEWSTPDLEDFDTDDLGEVADHFLISATGFPPENYTDLKLPVVEPNGDLNVNALSAVKGGRGVSAVDGLSEDMEERIVDWVNSTANDEFDRDWGEDEEENSAEENGVTSRNTPSDDAEPTHKMDPSVEDDKEMEAGDPVEKSLDLINTYLRENGKDERDSVDKMLGWLFGTTDIPTRKMEAFRVAANAFLDAQGGSDSFAAVDVESFRSWLLTQGGQTDDGVHARPTEPTSGSGVPRIATPVHVLSGDDLRSVSAVLGASKKDDSTTEDNTIMTDIEEELAELDEPVAVEKDDFEELQEKADRMDEMSETLASLQERTDVLDSVDREQVEELADSEEPVVLESSEYEELTAEAEQVKQVYAEALSGDNSPFTAEELTGKFSIEELREKYEEAGHDLEEELSPEPRSGDVEEEELEERAEEEQQSEEELERNEEIESKQAELRDKILGGN